MKNGLLLMILAISLTFSLTAQIGINTGTPHPSAALEIQSPPGGNDNRGVLFPRMTTFQRTHIASPAISLMVFDTELHAFFYHDGTNWLSFVPVESPHNSYGAYPTDVTPKMKGNIELDSGTVISPNVQTAKLRVTGFPDNALVPAGAILMWSGSPAAVPAGWGLCDGNFGRPDLRGRFVVGYENIQGSSLPQGNMSPITALPDGTTTNYGAIGNKGGEIGHVLTANEAPAHTHDYAGNTSNNGTHHHSVESYDNRENNNDGAGDRTDTARPGGSRQTSDDGDHSHSFSGTTSTNATPNSAHENRPPYYVLAYIIKLP